MGVKVTVQEHDTWDSIAARELGNKTLGGELAGFNARHEQSAPPVGEEISIPYRDEPSAADRACENCGATMPGSARYCSQCGQSFETGKPVAKNAKVKPGKQDGGDAGAPAEK